jgi:hypothetical protein
MTRAPEQTECRSGLPAGWLDHREFIRRVGKRIDPDWTGHEHLALSQVAERGDLLAAVDRMSANEAAAVFDEQIRAGSEPVAAGPPTGICVLCGALADTIKDGSHYCADHARQVGPKPVPEELRQCTASKASAPTDGDQANELRVAAFDDEGPNKGRAEAGREILRHMIMDQTSPEAEPRRRWNFAYSVVRDAVFADKLRPAAFCLGEISYPSVEEWRQFYPKPREFRVDLPSLSLPAWIAFREADADVVAEIAVADLACRKADTDAVTEITASKLAFREADMDTVAEIAAADPSASESAAIDPAVAGSDLGPANGRALITKDETDAAIGEFIRNQGRVTEKMLRRHFPVLTRNRIRQARRNVETPRRGRPKKSPG